MIHNSKVSISTTSNHLQPIDGGRGLKNKWLMQNNLQPIGRVGLKNKWVIH